MNYILKIQAENAALRAELAAVRQSAEDFRAHLSSSKFVGVDANGERNDWIATADANRYVEAILGATAEVA